VYLYANASKCEFSHFKITPLSLRSVLVSPEAMTEQGLDVCCRVKEGRRKFPLQIQESNQWSRRDSRSLCTRVYQSTQHRLAQVVFAPATCSLACFLGPVLLLLCTLLYLNGSLVVKHLGREQSQ